MDFFHVLNRGVDQRTVFPHTKDYLRFVHNLYTFNTTESVNGINGRWFDDLLDVGRQADSGNELTRERLVEIHFFCLMRNHYHLLLSPLVENGIPLFMKKLNGGYTKYFNEKYNRSGTLWQGGYKSVPVVTDGHFMHLPFYIHFNPLDVKFPEWRERGIRAPRAAEQFLQEYQWSSHLDYLGEKNFAPVIDRKFFLDYFGGEKGYSKKFKTMLRDFSLESVENITLE